MLFYPIIAIIVILSIFLIPKKQNATPTRLDKAGFVTNIVLSVLYVPMSVMGVMAATVADLSDPTLQTSQPKLLSAIGQLGVLILPVAAGGIALSVILRKKGHSKTSFTVQFIGLAAFLATVVLILLHKEPFLFSSPNEL